jgi:hypothetical protein
MASMSRVAQPPEIDEKGAKEFVMSTDFGSMTMMTKEEDDYVRVVLTNKNRKETKFWWKDCAKNCTRQSERDTHAA